jgi:putative addiction module antidote
MAEDPFGSHQSAAILPKCAASSGSTVDNVPSLAIAPPYQQRRPRQAALLGKVPRACYNARMNAKLKVRKFGNSAGVILPKELLARLRVEEGDTLFVTDSPDGVRLSAADPEFEAKMALAEKIMREDRDILRVLAK